VVQELERKFMQKRVIKGGKLKMSRLGQFYNLFNSYHVRIRRTGEVVFSCRLKATAKEFIFKNKINYVGEELEIVRLI